MTTRQDLRELCRRRLGDLSGSPTFSDLQVNQWINDALSDYSLHFPRPAATDLSTTAGEHAYDLPADFQAMARVEYPQGDDPPTLLAPRGEDQAGFWESDGYYSVRAGDAVTPAQVVISASPGEAETLRLGYLADHAWLDDETDVTTVPDRHLELIVLFVRWAALQELASSEAADPDPSRLDVSVLDTNAGRAERIYRKALEEAKGAGARSVWVSWG